jgi:ribosome recycling factor
MLDDVLNDAKERMGKAVEALRSHLITIRTGRATPALLDRLRVEYYGAVVSLKQVAAVAAPEPRLLTVRPWEASSLAAIERAILKSDLGLTPNNDGKVIRLAIPRLTEERRRELVKVVRRRVEDGRVSVRACRRDALKDLQEFMNEKMISEDDFYVGKDKVQALTDEHIQQMDEIGKLKEEEIMEI